MSQSGNGRFPRPRGSPPAPGSFPPSPRPYTPPLTPPQHHHTTPPHHTTTTGEQRAERAREAMLAGALRKRYGVRGAEALVRLNGFVVVNRAVQEYEELAAEGTEIRNAAGFIIWLVGQLHQLQEVPDGGCGE